MDQKFYPVEGELVHGHAFKENLPHNPRFQRMGIFQCGLCGDLFTTAISNVVNKITKSCGCLVRAKRNESKHPLYHRYNQIRARCRSKKSENWNRYGGRGIDICDEWWNDFNKFTHHLMGLPNALKRGYSIDRIDNDGNYEPGNVRWATHHQQAINTRIRANNSSGYRGVIATPRRNGNTFHSQTKCNGVVYRSPSYKTIQEALDYRNNILREMGEFERIQPLKESDRCAKN